MHTAVITTHTSIHAVTETDRERKRRSDISYELQRPLSLTVMCYKSKFVGSIPAGVSGFFIYIKSFRSHRGPGVDSASNRNEYQEYLLGVKAAGS